MLFESGLRTNAVQLQKKFTCSSTNESLFSVDARVYGESNALGETVASVKSVNLNGQISDKK